MFVDEYRTEVAGGSREATMELHPPAMWVFIVSLNIAVIAVIVLAVSKLVETQRTPCVAKECNVQS